MTMTSCSNMMRHNFSMCLPRVLCNGRILFYVVWRCWINPVSVQSLISLQSYEWFNIESVSFDIRWLWHHVEIWCAITSQYAYLEYCAIAESCSTLSGDAESIQFQFNPRFPCKVMIDTILRVIRWIWNDYDIMQ